MTIKFVKGILGIQIERESMPKTLHGCNYQPLNILGPNLCTAPPPPDVMKWEDLCGLCT
jgi:hypothetical protein